jgi:hypothetical protein
VGSIVACGYWASQVREIDGNEGGVERGEEYMSLYTLCAMQKSMLSAQRELYRALTYFDIMLDY